VEDEIFYLEKKVDDLRLRLRREQKWTDHCILHHQQQQQQHNRQQRHSVSVSRRELQLQQAGAQQLPRLPCPGPGSDEAPERESKASVGSASAKGIGRTDVVKCSARAPACGARCVRRRRCLIDAPRATHHGVLDHQEMRRSTSSSAGGAATATRRRRRRRTRTGRRLPSGRRTAWRAAPTGSRRSSSG
jgi:hypothetical protein